MYQFHCRSRRGKTFESRTHNLFDRDRHESILIWRMELGLIKRGPAHSLVSRKHTNIITCPVHQGSFNKEKRNFQKG